MIYQPREDSYLLQKQVKKYSRNKKVIDIGSGKGIQAETAIKAKAKSLTATDIDNNSISLLKNKFKNNENIKIVKSNLFSKINKKEKFDLIIFNPPYLPQDYREDKESAKATTGGKKGDEIILKFIKQANNYLSKDGIILIVISSLTPQNRINKLLSKLKLKKKLLAKQSFFMEKLEVWLIKKAQ